MSLSFFNKTQQGLQAAELKSMGKDMTNFMVHPTNLGVLVHKFNKLIIN